MIESIKNIEKLAEAFNRKRIPSFHDAEIVSICFNREENVFVDIKLHIYSLIKRFEKDDKKFGHWFNVYADFQFREVELEHFHDFNHQNTINDLHVYKPINSEKFLVHFETTFGCDIKFRCNEMELIKIKEFETEKEFYQPDPERLRLAKQAWKERQRESGK